MASSANTTAVIHQSLSSQQSDERAAQEHVPPELIKSRWDRYKREKLLEIGENFCLYQGRVQSSEGTVLIKEFFLSKQDFENINIQQRERSFEQLIHLNRKVSHSPDFRLVRLVDAVYHRASHHCYLITKPVEGSYSLETHLAKRNDHPMTASQIREVLRQVLETLRFLHEACWIRFSSDLLIKGIPHGNLSLKSLLIHFLETPNPSLEEPFFIYVADLALWEHLFLPPSPERLYPTGNASPENLDFFKHQDLRDLCRVAYQLAGGNCDADGNPIELETDIPWEALGDPFLGKYLRWLWRESNTLKVQTALQELKSLKTPSINGEDNGSEDPAFSNHPERKSTPWLTLAFVSLLLSVVGIAGVAGMVLVGQFSQDPITNVVERPRSKNRFIRDISLSSPVHYQIEADSAWESAMRQSLVRPGETVSQSTETPVPDLIMQLQERYLQGQSTANKQTLFTVIPFGQSLQSYPSLAQQIAAGHVDVGLVEKPSFQANSSGESGLNFAPVAYDGIAVFVPFGDAYRSRNSIGKLGHTIQISELRRLYTGTTDTPRLRGQTVKIFFPDDPAMLEWFKTLVLNNDPQLISQFDALHQQVLSRDRATYPHTKATDDKASTIRNNLYEKLLYEFETEGTIGIGFDRLSRMFNQCSVYPLALASDPPAGGHQAQRNEAIQPLRQSGGQPIQPTTDLCNAKGSYWLELPESYPLKIELGVVFPAGSAQGEAISQMLRTVEGQYLLSEAGLVPQLSMERIWRDVWGQTP